MVISPRFGEAGPFAEGRAKISKGGQYGYIDRTGKIVILPQFQSAEPFSEGLALVASGDYKYAFINRAGKTVIPPPDFKPVDFGPEEPGSRFSGGLAPVIIGEKCGFVDREGKLVIPPRFLNARNFSEGLAAIEVCSGWGYIDRSGKFVWQTTDPCDQWGKPLSE